MHASAQCKRVNTNIASWGGKSRISIYACNLACGAKNCGYLIRLVIPLVKALASKFFSLLYLITPVCPTLVISMTLLIYPLLCSFAHTKLSRNLWERFFCCFQIYGVVYLTSYLGKACRTYFFHTLQKLCIST